MYCEVHIVSLYTQHLIYTYTYCKYILLTMMNHYTCICECTVTHKKGFGKTLPQAIDTYLCTLEVCIV